MDHIKELDTICKEINRLEALQEKAEEDGVYDESIYSEIDRLEKRRLELEQKIRDSTE